MGIFSIEKNRVSPIEICTSDSYMFKYFPKQQTYDLVKKWDVFSCSLIGQKRKSSTNVKKSFPKVRVVSGLKICTSDSRISGYFPRGLTHGFGQKIQNFLEFVF